MNLLQLVVTRLSSSHYVSGQNLAEDFSVSRSAIWKTIARIKKRGVGVYSVKGRGYKLIQPIEWLDKKNIIDEFHQNLHLVDVDILFETDSTNNGLLKMSMAHSKLYLRACEWQSAGRGRQQRPWLAPMAAHLSFSLGRFWQHDISLLSGMSLAAGVAVIRALRLCGISGPLLKWPNDIVISSTKGLVKLGGILVEMKGNVDSGMQWVIGIGLNIDDTSSWQSQVDQPIIGLNNLSRSKISRNKLLSTVVKCWLDCEKLLVNKGIDPIIQAWREYDVLNGLPVQLATLDGVVKGQAQGVDSRGQLLVYTQGKLKAFGSGEVKIRKVTS